MASLKLKACRPVNNLFPITHTEEIYSDIKEKVIKKKLFS